MPLIDGGFLRDPHDVETIIKGLKTARSFARQQPLTGLLEEEIVPGGTAADDEALRVHAKRMVKTNYHPVGTCRMGPDGDPSAVVDPKSMSVRGLEGLHVIDCSVMPTIVSGNTNAPAMAIAHKAAGLIHAAQR